MKPALLFNILIAVLCPVGYAFCHSPIHIPKIRVEIYSNAPHDDTGDVQFNDRNGRQTRYLGGIASSAKSWGQLWRSKAKSFKFRPMSTGKKSKTEKADIDTTVSVPRQPTFENNSSLTLSMNLPSWLLPVIIVHEKAKLKRNQIISSSKSLLGNLNLFSNTNALRSDDASDDEGDLSYWGYGWPSPGTQSRLGGSWQIAEDSLRALSPESMSLAALSSPQTPQMFTETARAPLMSMEKSTEAPLQDGGLLQKQIEGIATDTPPLMSPTPTLPFSPSTSSTLPLNRSLTRTRQIRKAASSVAGRAWRRLSKQYLRMKNSSNSPAEAEATASDLLAAYAISPDDSARLADLSDVVYLPDLHEVMHFCAL